MASAENEFVYSKINFDEPQPAANRPGVIIGIVTTFLVSIAILSSLHSRTNVLTLFKCRSSLGYAAFSACTFGYGSSAPQDWMTFSLC